MYLIISNFIMFSNIQCAEVVVSNGHYWRNISTCDHSALHNKNILEKAKDGRKSKDAVRSSPTSPYPDTK